MAGRWWRGSRSRRRWFRIPAANTSLKQSKIKFIDAASREKKHRNFAWRHRGQVQGWYPWLTSTWGFRWLDLCSGPRKLKDETRTRVCVWAWVIYCSAALTKKPALINSLFNLPGVHTRRENRFFYSYTANDELSRARLNYSSGIALHSFGVVLVPGRTGIFVAQEPFCAVSAYGMFQWNSQCNYGQLLRGVCAFIFMSQRMRRINAFYGCGL